MHSRQRTLYGICFFVTSLMALLSSTAIAQPAPETVSLQVTVHGYVDEHDSTPWTPKPKARVPIHLSFFDYDPSSSRAKPCHGKPVESYRRGDFQASCTKDWLRGTKLFKGAFVLYCGGDLEVICRPRRVDLQIDARQTAKVINARDRPKVTYGLVGILQAMDWPKENEILSPDQVVFGIVALAEHGHILSRMPDRRAKARWNETRVMIAKLLTHLPPKEKKRVQELLERARQRMRKSEEFRLGDREIDALLGAANDKELELYAEEMASASYAIDAIIFDERSCKLSAESQNKLDQLAKKLKTLGSAMPASLRLEGHATTREKRGHVALSKCRSKAVRKYLAKYFPDKPMTSIGFGALCPRMLPTRRSSDDLAKRRVDIVSAEKAMLCKAPK